MEDSCLIKYVKKLDFVGPEFNFENNESSTYQSKSGILLSVITIVAICVISFLFGQELYERKNPNVALSKIFNKSSSYNIDDFPVIFTFHNSSGVEINNIEQFLDFHAIYHEMDFESKITNSILQILPCKTLNVTYNSQIINDFINGPLKTYCVKADDKKILNSVGMPDSKFLRYRFLLCNEKNTKRPTKCFLDPTILGQTITISISHLNTYIDSNRFSNPIVSYLDRFIQPISPGLFKIITFSVNNNVYYSDDGWLIESFRQINFLSLRERRMDFSLSSTTADNVVMNLLLESPFLIEKINRNYLKLQELFARIGELANAFYIIIKIFSNDYLRFKYLFFLRDESFGKMDANIKYQNMKGLAKSLCNKRQSNTFLQNFAKLNLSLIDELKNYTENLEKKEKGIEENNQNEDGNQNQFNNLNIIIDKNEDKNANKENENSNSKIQKMDSFSNLIHNKNDSNILMIDKNIRGELVNTTKLLNIDNLRQKLNFNLKSNSFHSDSISLEDIKHKEISKKSDKQFMTNNDETNKINSIQKSKYESKTENLNKFSDKNENIKKSISMKLKEILDRNRVDVLQIKDLKYTNRHNFISQKGVNANLKFDEKGVLIKENVSKMMFGDQEYEYSDEPNYFKYRINSILCCFKDEKLDRIYDFELKRVKMLLDIKLFKHFLIESYAKHYYVDIDQKSENKEA